MPALRTLASCWTFKKRAFSVSGKFRQTLTDLIKTKHNSNHKTQQTTLKGEIIQEHVYYVLGFVPAHILQLKDYGWFHVLDRDKISKIENYLDK